MVVNRDSAIFLFIELQFNFELLTFQGFFQFAVVDWSTCSVSFFLSFFFQVLLHVTMSRRITSVFAATVKKIPQLQKKNNCFHWFFFSQFAL